MVVLQDCAAGMVVLQDCTACMVVLQDCTACMVVLQGVPCRRGIKNCVGMSAQGSAACTYTGAGPAWQPAELLFGLLLFASPAWGVLAAKGVYLEARAKIEQVHACQVAGVLPSDGLLVGLIAVPGLFGYWVFGKGSYQGLCCSARECSCRDQLVSVYKHNARVVRDMGLLGVRQLLVRKECTHVVGDCCMNVCNRLVHRTLSPHSQQIAGTGAEF